MNQENKKKRKFGEMTNLGAGLDDADKHPDMREIEKQLHFMRYKDRSPKEFDLDTIDNKTSTIKIFLQLNAK